MVNRDSYQNKTQLASVLYVDDEANISTIVRIGLEKHFAVYTASTGIECLDLAASMNPKPDLILLDVRMPGLSGSETLSRLREQPETATIPVILITASVQEHEIETYRHLDVVGVIHKPFDPITLPDQIKRLASKA